MIEGLKLFVWGSKSGNLDEFDARWKMRLIVAKDIEQAVLIAGGESARPYVQEAFATVARSIIDWQALDLEYGI